MQGFNVLRPMGCDAFSLPSDQYAIEIESEYALVEWDIRFPRTCECKWEPNEWNFIHEYNMSDFAEDKADVVVAQDGSGDFTKIQEAINAWWNKRQEGKRYVTYVKAGVYEEYVTTGKEVWDITIFGDEIN
ncbi:putative pectinesterase, catalytic [Tanacetum coccineum]|uniref:Pectinesterase, catalytic n=1 Tax=Tanacetum coccineum TaxID=301880 RepID=A0ABQ5HIS6_9ASTR